MGGPSTPVRINAGQHGPKCVEAGRDFTHQLSSICNLTQEAFSERSHAHHKIGGCEKESRACSASAQGAKYAAPRQEAHAEPPSHATVFVFCKR